MEPQPPDFKQEREALQQAKAYLQNMADESTGRGTRQVAQSAEPAYDQDAMPISREELDAKFEALLARNDGRLDAAVARIEGKLDTATARNDGRLDTIAAELRAIQGSQTESREDARSNRSLLMGSVLATLLAVIGTGATVYFGLASNNASLIQSVTGAFALGNDMKSARQEPAAQTPSPAK